MPNQAFRKCRFAWTVFPHDCMCLQEQVLIRLGIIRCTWWHWSDMIGTAKGARSENGQFIIACSLEMASKPDSPVLQCSDNLPSKPDVYFGNTVPHTIPLKSLQLYRFKKYWESPPLLWWWDRRLARSAVPRLWLWRAGLLPLGLYLQQLDTFACGILHIEIACRKRFSLLGKPCRHQADLAGDLLGKYRESENDEELGLANKDATRLDFVQNSRSLSGSPEHTVSLRNFRGSPAGVQRILGCEKDL